MPTGTVKFFNSDRGYGFIAQEDGRDDVFVHARQCRAGELSQGDRVEFEIGQDRRTGKTEAQGVRVLR
jgi:CspA family cold shock protein